MVVTESEIALALTEVMDPEIPVLSVIDMGIISAIKINSDGITVSMTPTFVGCPAIDYIKKNIYDKLIEKGFSPITVLAVSYTHLDVYKRQQ